MKARNELNQQEQRSTEMFDSINEKLADKELVEQQAAGQHDEQASDSDSDDDDNAEMNDKELLNTNVNVGGPYDLNNEEAQCYLDRYYDISKAYKNKKDFINRVKIHWRQYGFNEGRNRNCADNITDQ